MGLGAEVGILADLRENDEEGYEDLLQQFTAVNEALRAEGLPAHREPDDIGDENVWFCEIGSYETIHHLRRLAAYLWAGRGLPQPGAVTSESDAALMGDCYAMLFDDNSPYRAAHLIFHSDAEGFYLPVPFRDVIYPEDDLGIAGGMIGSSPMLMEECQHIAAVLELPLDDGLVWKGEADWVPPEDTAQGNRVWAKYPSESRTCWLLHNACRVSIASGCAISFT